MARPRKAPADKLSTEIKKILTEYEGEVSLTVDEAVKKVARAGAKALRAESREKFNVGTKVGKTIYYSGWTTHFESGKYSKQGTIYNEDVPGLPHLLEHGHANRNGGRTPGRVHIKTIEDQVIKDFTKEVERGL